MRRVLVLMTALVDQLPDGITTGEPSIESEVRYGTVSGAGDTASSPAYWQITDKRNLVDEAGSSEHAFTALSQHLTENGWTYRRARVDDESRGVADGLRRTDQDDASRYVEIRWVRSTPDRAEPLQIVVVSPMTTRGQKAPENT